MNILFTTHFGGYAGSTYSIINLAVGLKARGHKIILASPGGSFIFKELSKRGILAYDVSFIWKGDIISAFRLNKIVKECHVDIISVQGSVDRYVAVFSKIFGHKANITITRRQRVRHNNVFKRWLQQRFSKKIIVNSEGLKQLMIRKGFKKENLTVINNGLPAGNYKMDDAIVNELRLKYGIEKNDRIIGCVSRLKRQDQLVKVLEMLGKEYKVLFVGIDKDSFQKKWERTKIPDSRVIFTGLIEDRNLVLQHYPLMAVNVLASEMDGFGLVLLEAMAMGVPVIGSDYGGIPSVIQNGLNGYIFRNDDLHELRDRILEVVNNRTLREKFIKEGQQTVDHFSQEKTVTGYESFFRELIES